MKKKRIRNQSKKKKGNQSTHREVNFEERNTCIAMGWESQTTKPTPFVVWPFISLPTSKKPKPTHNLHQSETAVSSHA